ncbi:MAG: hypothetical protein FWC50_02175 [Planctomycetaceae bacterium]|nr:hypothetical protein [Planctomycetaceae bacterium]
MIGTDEAGYGPNLGPLAVACTVWEIKNFPMQNVKFSDPLAVLAERLDPFLASQKSETGKNGKLLAIGDSKKLYQSGNIDILEKPVLAFVRNRIKADTEQGKPQFFFEMDESCLNGSCLHARLSSKLAEPLICEIASNLTVCLKKADVEICDIQAKLVSPRIFNELLEQFGKKSTLLTHITLTLIMNALKSTPESNVTILCDKHGGRNHYVEVLYEWFPNDGWIEIVTEGTETSVYRLKSQKHEIEFRFQSKADRQIPAGLASMTAKLLREFSMTDFNQFWRQHIPNITPTAGYPVDALRFWSEIETTAQKLGIPKSHIWREK